MGVGQARAKDSRALHSAFGQKHRPQEGTSLSHPTLCPEHHLGTVPVLVAHSHTAPLDEKERLCPQGGQLAACLNQMLPWINGSGVLQPRPLISSLVPASFFFFFCKHFSKP